MGERSDHFQNYQNGHCPLTSGLFCPIQNFPREASTQRWFTSWAFGGSVSGHPPPSVLRRNEKIYIFTVQESSRGGWYELPGGGASRKYSVKISCCISMYSRLYKTSHVLSNVVRKYGNPEGGRRRNCRHRECVVFPRCQSTK